MSIQESVKIIPQGDIAILEFDLVGEKANKLNTPVMTRLRELVQELAKSRYKAVMIRSNKPKIFIAGADIDEIKTMTTKEQFDKAVAQGQEIFCMIEDLPMPVIAVVHGACAGGGCELILSCDYRIASDAPETRIGLPETKLGIVPGFGGCMGRDRQGRRPDLRHAQDAIYEARPAHFGVLRGAANPLRHAAQALSNVLRCVLPDH